MRRDLYHHTLDHQVNSTGIQGYVICEDPHESRFDTIVPGIYACDIVLGLFILWEYADINVTQPQ